MHAPAALDWPLIDTVLLDMDGTLLDLRFDNWFWLDVIPSRYAAANGLSLDEARGVLKPRFLAARGRLDWYCIDHWSRELDLDVAAIKREARHAIGYLPGALEFLRKLKATGKRVVLVTNAHPVTLAIKDDCMRLTMHFDAWYSTHAFAVPKEDERFWPRLRAVEPFDPQRTLFVDDSLAVLDTARGFGITCLRAIRHPDSGGPPQRFEGYVTVDRVADLL